MQAMGFAEWDALAALALDPDRPGNGNATARTLPGAIAVRRIRNELVLARNAPD